MRRQQSVLTNDDLCVFLNSFLPSLHLLCTLHSVKCKTGPLWTLWVTMISFHFRWILCDLPWHGFRHLPPCSRCEVQRSHSGHYESADTLAGLSWWLAAKQQPVARIQTHNMCCKETIRSEGSRTGNISHLVVLPHLVMLHTSCQPPRPMGSDIGAPIGNAHCCRPNAWGIFVLSPTSFAAFHMNYINISIS